MKIHSVSLSREVGGNGDWIVTYWRDSNRVVEYYWTRNEARYGVAALKRDPHYVPGKFFVVSRAIPAANRHEAARKIVSLAKKQGGKFVKATV